MAAKGGGVPHIIPKPGVLPSTPRPRSPAFHPTDKPPRHIPLQLPLAANIYQPELINQS